MTVYCHGCGLPLESEVSEWEALEDEKARDPSIRWVKFLCRLCQELLCLERPEWFLEAKRPPSEPS